MKVNNRFNSPAFTSTSYSGEFSKYVDKRIKLGLVNYTGVLLDISNENKLHIDLSTNKPLAVLKSIFNIPDTVVKISFNDFKNKGKCVFSKEIDFADIIGQKDEVSKVLDLFDGLVDQMKKVVRKK